MSPENAHRKVDEGICGNSITAVSLSKRAGIILLILFFILVAVATGDTGKSPAQILSRIVPAGWELAVPVKRFVPKNLWEQIDGRAEFFLSFDMTEMTFAVFSDSSNTESFIDVSVYDMENPTNAFGVFSAERHQDSHPIRIGRQAYRAGGSLFIWKGLYYIRMIASEDNPRLQKVNRVLAERLTAMLHDTGAVVWGLDVLPEKDRVSGSEQFFLRDAMGLDFMQHTYTARYRKNDVVITVFLSRKESPADAGKILSRYASYARQFGEGIKDIKRNGVAITLCDFGGSYDALFKKRDVVAGVTAVENRRIAVDSAFELWKNLRLP